MTEAQQVKAAGDQLMVEPERTEGCTAGKYVVTKPREADR